jgi:hypothetical protein
VVADDHADEPLDLDIGRNRLGLPLGQFAFDLLAGLAKRAHTILLESDSRHRRRNATVRRWRT